MNEIDVKDRRAHTRHPTEVEVQGTPDQGGVVARMVTRNLSLGGLYCTSTAGFDEMTRLAVRLMLPVDGSAETVPVEVEAVVVRREELPSSNGRPRYELALFFPTLDEQARGQIRRYLDQRDA